MLKRPDGQPAPAADELAAGLHDLIARIVRVEVAKALAGATQPDDYLSTAAAGTFAAVAPGTIRRWIREGRLVGHRAGRMVRVRRAELERLLGEGARRATGLSPEEQAQRDFG